MNEEYEVVTNPKILRKFIKMVIEIASSIIGINTFMSIV